MPTCNNTNCMVTASTEELEWEQDVYGDMYCKPCNQYLRKNVGRQRPYRLAARRPVGCDQRAYDRHLKAITESEPFAAVERRERAAQNSAPRPTKRSPSLLQTAEADSGVWASPERSAKRPCCATGHRRPRKLFADCAENAPQAEDPAEDAAAEATEALLPVGATGARPGSRKPIHLPPLRCDSSIAVFRDSVAELPDRDSHAVERSLSLALSLPDDDVNEAEDVEALSVQHVNWYLPRSPTELSPNGKHLYACHEKMWADAKQLNF